MWSGPRNISTAMMRAWENRPDTVVWDEPLYAWYLKRTGLDHPMREEILAAHDTDLQSVTARAAEEPLPDGATIFYQKHMTHHLLPEADRAWTDGLRNCFLIRDPREVLLSYVKKRADVSLADLGSEQQIEIFERVRKRTGRIPPVVDGRDVLENPRGMLRALCDALGVPFSDAMLEWPAGPRETDGVWADHWYDSVRRSTGFAAYRPREGDLPEPLAELARACEPHYRMLAEHRIRV
ncbi:MAG: HAD family hydrolase [Gemmatimonadetes bacterium]|nr:HAD family hydrolase [Gemmatimonadota bacterium]